jgi:hypothetical protein
MFGTSIKIIDLKCTNVHLICFALIPSKKLANKIRIHGSLILRYIYNRLFYGNFFSPRPELLPVQTMKRDVSSKIRGNL